MTTKIPNLRLVTRRAEEEQDEANNALASCKALEIMDPQGYRAAAETVAEVKRKAADLDEQRRSWVDPLNAVVKSINAAFQPVIRSLGECEAVLKAKLVEHANTQAMERDRLIRRAGEASQRGQRTKTRELLVQAEEAVVPRVAGLSMRTEWTGEVSDATLIPREYLVVDEQALRALTCAKGGDPGVPGWKAYPKTTAAMSAAPEDV